MSFPKLKPQRATQQIIDAGLRSISTKEERKRFYNALRNSSSAFIKRSDVRSHILARDNNSCVICGSVNNLQIDHIQSVYACFRGLITFDYLNSEINLQALCNSCNAAKRP